MERNKEPQTCNTLKCINFSLPSSLAIGILIHGSIHSYVCCYLMVHYSYMISVREVSIEHVILSVQILQAENTFIHPTWHLITCYEVFQPFGPF